MSMSVVPAKGQRVFEIQERPPQTLSTRKSVAIGDLHGDFYRLTRILEEEGILIPGTGVWDPRACNVDLILIGDYVDWRGEPLEGPPERASEGARRILELLFSLHHQVGRLRETYEDFDGRLYALRGNHDDMMLDAMRIFDVLKPAEVELLMKGAHHYVALRKTMSNLSLTGDQVEVVMKFLNWFVQGGRTTIEGWGTVEEWKKAMEGELGDWIAHDLLLGAVVNRRVYAHTAPDAGEFWRPLEELATLTGYSQLRLRESLLWSRRLWGFDYVAGARTEAFTVEELDAMLSGLGVEGIVVGHTPVTSEPEPLRAYNGKVINIDQHGIPNSRPFVEQYEVDPATVRGVDGATVPPPVVLLTPRQPRGVFASESIDVAEQEADDASPLAQE